MTAEHSLVATVTLQWLLASDSSINDLLLIALRRETGSRNNILICQSRTDLNPLDHGKIADRRMDIIASANFLVRPKSVHIRNVPLTVHQWKQVYLSMNYY